MQNFKKIDKTFGLTKSIVESGFSQRSDITFRAIRF